MPIDFFKERLLDIEAFHDGFDDPVAAPERAQLVGHRGGAHETGCCWREKRVRRQLPRPLQSFCRGLPVHIEQRCGQTGVGEKSGNLRAHRTGAHYRC
jgi:hypothetical protein